jgi:hypothetical protein
MLMHLVSALDIRIWRSLNPHETPTPNRPHGKRADRTKRRRSLVGGIREDEGA